LDITITFSNSFSVILRDRSLNFKSMPIYFTSSFTTRGSSSGVLSESDELSCSSISNSDILLIEVLISFEDIIIQK